MSQMLKSSGAMALATLFSRILGCAREIIYAWFMGDGVVAGAFKLAFQIPNLFRRLLGEGALSAAFIPIFKQKEKEGVEAMWHSANAVVSGLIIACSVVTVVGMVVIAVMLSGASATPPASDLPSPAGAQVQANMPLMLSLLQVMFPYLVLVCVTAAFIGMLNARGRFFTPALGAALLNVGMIGSVLLAHGVFSTRPLREKIFVLAWGVLAAGVAQLVFQYFSLRRMGYRYRWVRPWQSPVVREVVVRMIPGTFGVAVFQINVLVTNVVASFVDARIVASFDYAVRLMELPQGLFGISLATYLLPTLAGMAVDKNWQAYKGTLTQGLGYLIFINLLASVLLVILALPIVRLLFERGAFGPDATMRAARALIFLGPGLIVFSMVNVFARAYYAVGNTRTPMKISIICMVVNLFLALVLVHPMHQAGLALANTLSACLNLVLLQRGLEKQLGPFDWGALHRIIGPLVLACAAAGSAAWWLLGALERQVGHAGLGQRAMAVFVPMAGATLVYWMIAMAFKVAPAREVLHVLRRKKKV